MIKVDSWDFEKVVNLFYHTIEEVEWGNTKTSEYFNDDDRESIGFAKMQKDEIKCKYFFNYYLNPTFLEKHRITL